MAPQPIYVPPQGFTSYLDDFRSQINREHSLRLDGYHQLHAFSIDRPNDFWLSLWHYLPIKASVQPFMGVDESVPIDQLPEFYLGARLNYAENLLSKTGSDVAVRAITESDNSGVETITWDSLRERVRCYASAMRVSGLRKGDTVCVVGGSNIKSLCLLLATASIGAMFSSFATDAGERVLIERINQMNPKFLFSETSYSYNGKRHYIMDRINNVWETVKKPKTAQLVSTTENDIPSTWAGLDNFLSRDDGRALSFEQVPFHTPFVVMFSSGTTGTPKGIVHSQGGLIVNGMKEHLLHYNHDDSAIHFHYAGIGWTLWNIMIGALFTGASITLYDGSPFYPSPLERLKSILATGVTSFGAGPRYFSELQKAGVDARPYVGRVDKIPSAGALLTASTSQWIAQAFGSQICQISTSGGTELAGNFVHGTQTLPVYAGENAVKCLGMDVDIFDSEGRPIPADSGQAGELVCKKPFPNMPAKFLNDADGKRYHAAYFEKFPHVWTHGDFMKENPDTGGLIILGRSDGVLNPSGIRFGSGEIYTILERDFKQEVTDAIVVGQQRDGKDPSERVLLFLKLAKGSGDLNVPDRLTKHVKAQITKDLSRRHVPSFFFAVEQIPYNVNGKKLEIPLRAVVSEGDKAFTRRKFTREEKEVLELYLPFFFVEDLVTDERTGAKAKL